MAKSKANNLIVEVWGPDYKREVTCVLSSLKMKLLLLITLLAGRAPAPSESPSICLSFGAQLLHWPLLMLWFGVPFGV